MKTGTGSEHNGVFFGIRSLLRRACLPFQRPGKRGATKTFPTHMHRVTIPQETVIPANEPLSAKDYIPQNCRPQRSRGEGDAPAEPLVRLS